jgi:membrane-bound metal-dependent hydrolase YbcI (DUF457 family)
MPVTPFHFGPGAALHAVAPRQVSFLAFCGANVLIDIEPLTYMLSHQYPLHRFFHTLVGATLIWPVTALIFLGLKRVAEAIWLPNIFNWKDLTLPRVIAGALLGAYTHILFDGLMHADMRPLAPFSDANPLLELVPLGALHWFCIIAGVAGVAVVLARRGLWMR